MAPPETTTPPFGGDAPWAAAPKPIVLANWPQRILAYGIDLLTLIGILLLLQTFAVAAYGESEVLLVLLASGLTFAYFLASSFAGGRSPGKRLLRLRTARLDGSRPSVVQSVLDALSKSLLPLLVLDWLVGLLAARGKRQRLVQAAGGLVVLFEPPPAPKRVVFVP